MNQAIGYKSMKRAVYTPIAPLEIDHGKVTYWQEVRTSAVEQWNLVKAFFAGLFDPTARMPLYAQHMRAQLRTVGISGLDLLKAETFSITEVLNHSESILAAICGQVEGEGFGLLVITDSRVVYINQIPFFTNMDEFGHDMVTGVSSRVGRWDATITLHTRNKDYVVKSVNLKAAHNFIHVIENHCMSSQYNNGIATELSRV